MIGTEQERAALMAAVESFGELCRVTECAHHEGTPDQIEESSQQEAVSLAAIRAMLAPDDAVVIPRALAERAVEALSVYGHLTESMEVIQRAHDDAESLRAVLRGEATRDE